MSASAWPSTFSLFFDGERLPQFALRGVGQATPRNRARSVQPEDAVDSAQFGRLDQLGMRNGDGEQRAFEILLPEREKILQSLIIQKLFEVLSVVDMLESGWNL